MDKPLTLPHVLGPAPGLHLGSGPLPKRRPSARNAWMITFADLIALMLTFFVLLFSMSQLEQHKWQSLVESLASNLSAIYNVESTKLAADYQVEVPITVPAADLDYIEPILREHFAAEPLLAGGSIDRVEGGLSVSFPDERLFVGGTPELSERGEKVIFTLGSVLRNLDNAVDVNAYIQSGETIEPADWENSLARSVAVVRILAQSGFAGPIVARGQGDGGEIDKRNIRADRLNILVREDNRK
jgi:chemotaxis protein MotB